ncbi:hypothetical protein DACRYDRAFT_119658 [Dacryopinax primogenitus]|uniref:BAR domain-containing protein n=1 Tax=Dacryopinax primogenitus (strain DJM 731) TaxID=1858805 RepID=M5FNC3_DACPD|nr:uncharacterized protein DACRYDRAFT_119658 [Dacryopinax primogenitus]EJT97195.1 hypothetical protein DACRYDRAFT_119658 [Dacryopinax primogenitus]
MSLGKLRKWGKGFAKDLKGPDSPRSPSPASSPRSPPEMELSSAFDDDLLALDSDLQLRRRGLERLVLVSQAYTRAFYKRKDLPDPAAPLSSIGGMKKLNPQESLALHLQAYGDAHGETPFGRGMAAYGRAREEVYVAWREWGKRWAEGWEGALESGLGMVKEVQGMRKGLEKKRQAHETSVNRLQRAKEKNAEAMEDDVSRSYSAYETALSTVQSRVLEIEEFEQSLLARTVQLVEEELEFVAVYRDALTSVKDQLLAEGIADHRTSMPKRSSRASLAPIPPFGRRLSARSLHSSHSLHSLSPSISLSSDCTSPAPSTYHQRAHSHTLKREGSRRWGGETGWAEVAAEPPEEDELAEHDPSNWKPSNTMVDPLRPPLPRKPPSRHSSLGKLQIPPRTPPRSAPLLGQSTARRKSLIQTDESDGGPDEEASDADLPGGAGDRQPLSAGTTRAPALPPSLPPRRAQSLRVPPPTPPRNGGYAASIGAGSRKERAEEAVKSPFDTTDESDA